MIDVSDDKTSDKITLFLKLKDAVYASCIITECNLKDVISCENHLCNALLFVFQMDF